ncbi:MAG: DUF1573 domain-containing protein [Acidobacteriota bacterium]
MNRAQTPAILTLCAAVLLAGAAFVPSALAEDQPQVVLPKPVFDAGVTPKGEKITHDFSIRNEGAADLMIVDVRPACGCTIAEFDKTIAPGASGKIHAVLDTTTFAGPISKGITVLTNDPANPRLELAIKADVQPYLFVQPGFARFIQAQHSDPGSVEQILFTRTFDDLQVLKVDSPYPFLDVTYTQATEDDEPRENAVGNQWIFVFTLDYDKAPVGTLADYVTIHTNHPDQPILKVPVSGFVRPMIAITPKEADFGDIAIAEQNEASMVIRSFANEEIELTSAETNVPGVDLKITPIEEGRRFSLEVTLSPDMPKGDFEGTIQIRTDSERKPMIEVPLRGTAI